MASGNREAPAFPVHAGFAILPRLIAKTVINTVQAASDTVTEPHCEKGKKSCPISVPGQEGRSQREGEIDTSTGSGPRSSHLGALPTRMGIPGRASLKRIQRQFFC